MDSNAGGCWSKFLEDNLLYARLLDGIYLMSSYGEKIHCWGPTITDEECKQFVGIFNFITEKQDLLTCQRGFHLGTLNNIKVHYKVYKKTYCSMYCVSDNRQSGLVVCNLPYGVFIATYTHPVKAEEAIDLVERACALLRS